VPWTPELFTAPALARVWEDERLRRLALVPFFDGLRTGEIGALVESFAGVPQVHHPVRGRIMGVAAFERFAAGLSAWMTEHDASTEQVGFLLTPARGVEELVLRADGEEGRVEVPMAIASDHDASGRITEQRVYFSSLPVSGRLAIRPPLLQPDELTEAADAVGDYGRALAAGDAEAAVAAFEPDGYLREPAGEPRTHRGAAALRAVHERLFANGGGITLERCAAADDGAACALEYNVVAWGPTALAPQAGLTVHVRGDRGRLAAVRVYDDVEPPPPRPES
jgi:hypothetical protein